MASGQQQYGQYGGNPYGSSGGNRYGETYGGNDGGYGSSNPYGGAQSRPQAGLAAPPPLSQQNSNYSQPSQYEGTQGGITPANTHQPLSNQDFLNRVEGVKASIRELTANIGEIGTLHQRALSATDNSTSAQLEHIVSQTQILNSRIMDQIKFLEVDAKRSGGNTTKDSQIRTLKQTFQNQLQQYRQEEQAYKARYTDQIARQYKIVNPNASEDEVREASQANWGDEGVFQTALKSNRSGHAQSVLGAVRARHNDIQQIEKTLIELNQLFEDLAQQVVLDEPVVQAIENQTVQVHADTEAANVQLTKGVDHARRARKLKWWCLGITLLIILIIALAVGLTFGLQHTHNNNNS